MSKNFYHLPDAQFAQASAQFFVLINAAPASYGTSAAQAAAYGVLNTAYQTALNLATGQTTRTKLTIGNKDLARKALKDNAMFLAGIIRGTPTVTNPQLESLGLLPRTIPTPRPVPSTSPMVEVIAVVGRLVKIRVHDATSERRGLPFGARGANIYSFVGTSSPTDPRSYHFEGMTTRAATDILFPDSVASGATVWLSACWVSDRGQTGTGSTPISFTLQGGAIGAAA